MLEKTSNQSANPKGSKTYRLLRVIDLECYESHNGEESGVEIFPEGKIPAKHQWAFDHIVNQDCRSISCGNTVYEMTGFKAGNWIVYDDGRPGHTLAVAQILFSDAVKMVVQFDDRADTTTIRFADEVWMKHISFFKSAMAEQWG